MKMAGNNKENMKFSIMSLYSPSSLFLTVKAPYLPVQDESDLSQMISSVSSEWALKKFFLFSFFTKINGLIRFDLQQANEPERIDLSGW